MREGVIGKILDNRNETNFCKLWTEEKEFKLAWFHITALGHLKRSLKRDIIVTFRAMRKEAKEALLNDI